LNQGVDSIMITKERIKLRELSICVVGLGYVGLPTAIGFHDAGFNVIGLDISEHVINSLLEGKNPINDPSFNDSIPKDENWKVTINPTEAIPLCDVIIVTVPTPVLENNQPDLRFVKNAGITIFDNIDKGKKPAIILESTVYPGVTREIWGPLLGERGLKDGVDLHLAYCPERFVPGDPNHGVRQVPRVIGANDATICSILADFYSNLTQGEVYPVSSIEVAEAAKVVENVQRDLNIALVNELALIFPEIGLDVEEVLTAAATKWNFHRYNPGIGVGGHCIPVDPHYLIQKAKSAGAPVELITSARSVNSNMPKQVATRILKNTIIQNHNFDDLKVLLLGWSYKPGISDTRETPSKKLAQELSSLGCTIYTWDPYIPENIRTDEFTNWVNNPSDAKADIVVLCTAHPEVLALDWEELLSVSRVGLFFDGRRVLNSSELTKIGWTFSGIGLP